jgi:HK97 family phage major capsid protein
MSRHRLDRLTIGYTRKGQPIYAIAGGDGTDEGQPVEAPRTPIYQTTDSSVARLIAEPPTEQIGELAARMKAAVDIMSEAKADDQARWEAADAERKEAAQQLGVLMAEHERKEREERTAKATAEMESFLADVRKPSKAHLIGAYGASAVQSEYKAGSFIGAIAASRSRDYEEQAAGKAKLRELGMSFGDPTDGRYENYGGVAGKATLGSTDATGGYLIPNNLVDDFIKPAAYRAWFRQICTHIFGVNGNVDIPFRNHAQNVNTRATVTAWGATKPNTNLVYDGYTATMYTIARIYDVARQFLRQSQGAAEQDVMSELSDALLRGEGYYILRGSGSSEPYGVLTALDAAGDVFDVSHTASNSTVAGSFATGLAKAAGALAGRGVEGRLSAVVSPANYWTFIAQGSDTAGFWVAPTGGPTSLPQLNGASVNPGTLISPWGIPVFPDINMEADHAIIGQWDRVKVYHGDDVRIDTSDEAGERWDKNLVGFRGEMEMALDARAAVYAGYFALIEDAVA